MSIIATAVRHMLAAGITGEALVQAIAEMEAAQVYVDPVAEKRRAYDRERKREAKARSTGIPPESEESVERVETPSLSLPPNENISNPPTHTHPEPIRAREGAEKTVRGKLAHRLPDGWKPILTVAAQSTVDGWPPGMLAEQLAAFIDHAADKGRTSKDWQAAFRTWITKANQWKPRNAAQPGRNDQHLAPSGRTMGRSETAARAAIQRTAPPVEAARQGGGHGPTLALPDPLRTVRNVG